MSAPARPGWLPPPRRALARWLKWGVAGLLVRLGALRRAARRRAARGEAVVLVFHRVVTPADETPSQPGMAMTEESFRALLRCLVDSSELLAVVPASAAVARAPRADGRLAVAITFDDGWRDTEEVAAPLLAERNLPATLFVAAGYIGTDRLFWPERVVAALSGADRLGRARLALQGEVDLPRDSGDAAEALIAHLKMQTGVRREETLSRIGEPGPPRPGALLSWDAVRVLASSGMEIGSHGMEHLILTQIPLPEAERDLASARELIARQIGRAPEAIAYPNGNATAEIAELAARVGHTRGYVVAPVPGEEENVRLLPRRNVHEGTAADPFGRFSPSLFLCECLGLLDGLKRPLAGSARLGLPSLVLLLGGLLALLAPTVRDLVETWAAAPGSAHGFLVPIVAVYLAWRRRGDLPGPLPSGSWKGAALLATGLAVAVVGVAGSSATTSYLALVICVWGVVWARLGDAAARALRLPLAYLLLAIPIPFGLEVAVSIPLRHLASQIAVGAAAVAGVPLIHEGNVIHLSHVSLNVDDACSGLRSLVSLIVLGVLYIGLRGRWGGRLLLCLCALPALAVVANAVRLLATILAVRWAGVDLAQGWFHSLLGGMSFGLALVGFILLERVLWWRAPRRAISSS